MEKKIKNPKAVLKLLVGLIIWGLHSNCAYFLTNQLGLVKRIYDGDTILLSNGEKVRYLYIDTPEIHHPSKPSSPLGYSALKRNAQLLSSKKVVISFDLMRRDRYGRLLARVWNNCVYVNAELVKEGYARIMIIPPNQADKNLFINLQRQAQKYKKGIWALSEKMKYFKPYLGNKNL